MRICAAAVAACLIGFALLVAPANAVGATSAAADFVAGSGNASANLFGVNIPYSGANIGLGLGEVRARYFEDNAGASSQRVDPTFLGIAKLLNLCGESSPINSPDALEASTDNTGGKPDVKSSSPGVADASALTENAAAYPGARGVGDATGGTFGLPGLVKMDGGTSHAEASVDPKTQVRTVGTDVRIGQLTLANGLVVLGDMHWHLEDQVAGVDSRTDAITRTATFTMGSASLAGKAVPVDSPTQLAAALAKFNAALRPIGLAVRLPQLITQGRASARYTPFTVAVGGNTAYGSTLYPLLAGTSGPSLVNLFFKLNPTVFEPVHCKELFGLFSKAPEVNFIWNYVGVLTPIIVSAAAAAVHGGAEFDVDFGGSNTLFDDTYYPPRAPRDFNSPPIDFGGGSGIAAEPGAPGSLGALPHIVDLNTKATTSCASTSTTGSRGCWPGKAGLAAGAAGVLTLGLIATDEVVRRRRIAARAAVPIENEGTA